MYLNEDDPFESAYVISKLVSVVCVKSKLKVSIKTIKFKIGLPLAAPGRRLALVQSFVSTILFHGKRILS